MVLNNKYHCLSPGHCLVKLSASEKLLLSVGGIRDSWGLPWNSRTLRKILLRPGRNKVGLLLGYRSTKSISRNDVLRCIHDWMTGHPSAFWSLLVYRSGEVAAIRIEHRWLHIVGYQYSAPRSGSVWRGVEMLSASWLTATAIRRPIEHLFHLACITE